MFCREDIELIVNAMYKDELRYVSEQINHIKFNISEVDKINSGLSKYLGQASIIWKKLRNLFKKNQLSTEEALSRVVLTLSEKESKYKLELEKLNLKKSEIDCVYQYIMDNIKKDDLSYVENLILMRSIQENGGRSGTRTRTLQFLME